MRVRNQIRPHDPKELMRAMDIAVDLEEVENEEKKMIPAWSTYSNFRYMARMGMTGELKDEKGGMDKQDLSWRAMLERNIIMTAKKHELERIWGKFQEIGEWERFLIRNT